jgi:hypothetical protein
MSVQYTQPITAPPSGDPITQLPVDHNPPSNTEVQIIDTLFRKHRSTMDVIAEESKDAVLVAILVIAFSLVQVDNLIMFTLPMTRTSPYILVLIKGIIAAVLYWLIKHFYLSRSSS